MGDKRREYSISKREMNLFLVVLVGVVFLAFLLSEVYAAEPANPDLVNVTANETKGAGSQQMVNISGGRIATLSINATIQNPRWKGFVGNVLGKFTLDDASGSTLYDWSLTVTSGRVYATRNSSSISWDNIKCANSTTLTQEDIAMNHTGSTGDNITATFNATNDTAGYGTHDPFYVGGTYISANSCPNLNTYVNSGEQYTDFDEVALYDGASIIYAALLEDDAVGFDGNTYDFQMIVPERGLPDWDSSTAYYIYVELG